MPNPQKKISIPNFPLAMAAIDIATTTDNTIFYWLVLLSLISTFIVRFLIKRYINPSIKFSPPPSPPALPIIGHLHLVGTALPKSFQTLARQYGPIMQLRIGSSSTFVIASSGFIAKQIFKTYDQNFASRFEVGPVEYNIYKDLGFITGAYGSYWQFMRKLSMSELFAGRQLDRFNQIRAKEINNLLNSLMKLGKEGLCCDLNVELETLTNNLICKMAMSKRFCDNDDEAKKMRKLVANIMEKGAKLGVIEVFGILKKIDVFGHGRNLRDAMLEYDRFIEQIMKDYEENLENNNGDQEKDVMHILLETYRHSNAQVELTRPRIKCFILELFMASIDTESAAIQWAMAELINHPKVFNKLREEINSVVNFNRLVKESDVRNLPYLQAIVKESLRLHPPAALIYRECIKDCRINGYDLRANTRVLINAYAIMRDPDTWHNPNEYIPERFMVNGTGEFDQQFMEKQRQDYSYLPFGGGRRACLGSTHAYALMHTTIGALVQCFDWKLKNGDKIDINVANGFSGTTAPPLLCYPIPHFNPSHN